MAQQPNTANDARMAQQLQNQEFNAAGQAQYGYPQGPHPQGYPGQGYTGQGYTGQGFPGQVYPQPGYPAVQATPVYPGQPQIGVPMQQGYQHAQISPRWVPFVSTRVVAVSPEHMQLCHVVYRSNTVKLLAFLDWVFLLLAHWTPAVAILSLMPLCGFIGAKSFNKCCIWTYTIYLFWLNVSRLALMGLMIQHGEEGALFLFIASLLGLFIFSFVLRFALDVNKLTPEQRMMCVQIRDGRYAFNSML